MTCKVRVQTNLTHLAAQGGLLESLLGLDTHLFKTFIDKEHMRMTAVLTLCSLYERS